MKKKNYAAFSRSWLKTGTRKGFGMVLTALLLTSSFQQAGAIEIVRPTDFGSFNTSLSGYAIAPINPDNTSDKGTVAAGNIGYGKAVHFAAYDQKGGMVRSAVLQFPQYNDVRAIAIASIDGNRFCITVQARANTGEDRIILAIVDINGNIIQTHEIDVLPSQGEYTFVTHSLLRNDDIFISGYVCSKGALPEDPEYAAAKTAFVLKMDMNTRVNTIHYFNTAVNTNPVSNPAWNGQYNDYDAALRLKIINDRLYVMGSANGSTVAGFTSINSSKAWISQLDMNTLAPNTTSYYGSNATSPAVTPSTLNGSYALDLIPDVQMNGTFYGLSNDLFSNTFRISHLGSSLAIGVPTSGSNSVAYNAAGATIKGTGFYESLTGSNRVGLYGMVGSQIQITTPTNYGTVIASPTAGGVPFAMGIDLGYGNTIGMNYSGQVGHVLGNKPGYATGLNYQEPFWTNGAMGEWCNMPFGMRLKPMFGTIDDFAMVGHFNSSGSGYANPRYVGTSMNGSIITCESDQEMVFGLGLVNLQGATLQVDEFDETCDVTDAQAQSVQIDPDDLLECSYHVIYRTAKPGTAMEQASEKGIYPNPATDRVTVILGSDVAEGDAVKIILTDVTGRVVLAKDFKASGNSLQLALPRLTAGMYQATVSVGQNQASVYKLVIQ